MLKKTLTAFSLMLVIVMILGGCSGGGDSGNFAQPDKPAIPIPDYFIPEGVDFEYDDDNKSSAYFETTMTTEEAMAFYKDAFKELGVTAPAELTESELIKSGVAPEPSTDSFGSIAWAYYGNYPKIKIELDKDEKLEADKYDNTLGYATVIVSESGDKVGVEVSIGYRAFNIATQAGFIAKPVNDATQNVEG